MSDQSSDLCNKGVLAFSYVFYTICILGLIAVPIFYLITYYRTKNAQDYPSMKNMMIGSYVISGTYLLIGLIGFIIFVLNQRKTNYDNKLRIWFGFILFFGIIGYAYLAWSGGVVLREIELKKIPIACPTYIISGISIAILMALITFCTAIVLLIALTDSIKASYISKKKEVILATIKRLNTSLSSS